MKWRDRLNCSALMFLTMLLLVSPALADTPAGTLRVLVSSANPTGDWTGDLDLGGGVISADIEADSALAFGIVYEVRVNKRWGVESGLYFADFDFDLEVAGVSGEFGDALAIPFWLGVNYHLYSGEKIDLYVGPQLSYTLWGDLDTPVGSVTVDEDFGIGAVAGLDVRLGSSGWTFNAGLRYLGMALSDSTAEVDVDPLFAEIGLGFRF